jgi:hypothetical protein
MASALRGLDRGELGAEVLVALAELLLGDDLAAGGEGLAEELREADAVGVGDRWSSDGDALRLERRPWRTWPCTVPWNGSMKQTRKM